ncbi:hypothetical protein GGR50DRAFT_328199 [Xylaria sp. CBS 124048]|nr:hypothetical protein GGR50DRAFT_328199 [Xylaria sp. CBS 124048]
MGPSPGPPPKVIITRPSLSLRKPAPYQGEKGPLSSTSSRFNFNHLLFTSPPPSPSLPALVPRPRKSSLRPRPSRVLRALGWIFGLAVLLLLARILAPTSKRMSVLDWILEDTEQYEPVAQKDLPKVPTPVTITDRHGKSRWTVSIPSTYRFPLSMKEYSDVCAKCHEVAARVRELHGHSPIAQQKSVGYYHGDSYFMDVRDAEKQGLLPSMEEMVRTESSQAQEKHLVGERHDWLVGMETCRTSLTFVLESPDAGLGSTLMMLWMAYGLAQKEERAFFIEDSRWAYGVYTDMFKSSPIQNCRPPPRHQMLPCPRNAKHLIVSAVTAREIFGDSFNAEYENSKKADVNRERPIYDLARTGYEALFRLNNDDRPYVNDRVKELKAKASVPRGNYNDGTIIGVHVRQGDLHPFEYEYNGAYIPLDQYVRKFEALIEARHNFSTPLGGEDVVAKQHSFMVVASDNPDVYEADELRGSYRAQEQIKLAGIQNSKAQAPDRSMMRKFVDEEFGWEGGFFASMFWNLGHVTSHNGIAMTDSESQEAKGPSADVVRLRGLIGRAYVMDLAVLGEASDAVICTMSAMGCRLLAVIMGWEKAMTQGNWVNIDGNYMWSSITL